MSRVVSPSDEAIKDAARILREGGLVAMPTETVYGLAANALDGKAVSSVFEAKGRPQFNPLICHFAAPEDVALHAEMHEKARLLAHHFWPGPLTLVLRRKPGSGVSELVSAGLETLAVRVPAHPVAQKLLNITGLPLAAPSANLSGKLSATTPAHVAENLKGHVKMILAAGACPVGIESTVLDMSGAGPVILRPGAITDEDIAAVLEQDVLYDAGQGDSPRSPGRLLKHYAPETRLRLNAVDLEPGEALLAFGSEKFMGIKGGGAVKDLPGVMRRNLSEDGDLHVAAANLFAMLKELDAAGAKAIAVMSIPETGLGIAINDRLRRAAA